jgi:hypothetical protein
MLAPPVSICIPAWQSEGIVERGVAVGLELEKRVAP